MRRFFEPAFLPAIGRLARSLLGIVWVVFAAFSGTADASKLSTATLGRTSEEPVKASLHAEPSIDASDRSLWLVLRLEHAPGWHTYWLNPGDSGLATQVEWSLPRDWPQPKALWPMPDRIPVGPLMNFGYEGDLWVPWRLDLPKEPKPGSYPIKAHVRWLMCSDVCIPGEAKLGFELMLPASRQPQSAEMRKALAQVPQKTLRMHDRRDGERLILSVEPSSEEARALADGRTLAKQSIRYFPEQAGWMINPAQQVLEPDPQGGWTLPLSLDPSFREKVLIDGYMQIGSSSYRVIGPRSANNMGSASNYAPTARSTPATELSSTQQGLALLMLMGLIGGLLLNAMPCVFPVIGIKLLSLVPPAELPPVSHHEPSARAGQAWGGGAGAGPPQAAIERGVRNAALFYGLGVLLSFWALGLIVVLLQAGGQSIGWGFQLQEPGFVLAMFWLFMLIGANLLGLFEVGSGLMRWAAQPQLGAFGSGVLAVLVATPCTAPMMGAALGASLSQGPVEAMAVFTALALGMALPYAALVIRPQWIHRLPRPGPWMVWIRKALAFPMFLAAVWLAWVFVLQTDQQSVLRLGFSAVLLLCATWLFGEVVQGAWMRSERRPWTSAFSLMLLLGSLIIPLAATRSSADLPMTSQSPKQGQQAWADWSPEAVEAALDQDEIVFIDFTAAWCVSCQANKQLVLETKQLSDFFASQKVRSFRGDWTRQDPRITETLAQYGRRGVPLYLVLRRGRQPQVLPEVLTYGLVRDAVLAAAAP